MRAMTYAGLATGIVLLAAGCTEPSFEPSCTPLPEPPRLTRLVLLSDSLTVRDTTRLEYIPAFDTLWVELAPAEQRVGYTMALIAAAPAGDYAVLRVMDGPPSAFLLTSFFESAPVPDENTTYSYRVPEPGEYQIHGLREVFNGQECHNLAGSWHEQATRYTGVNELAAIGLARRSFVVRHSLSESPPHRP